MEELVIQQHQTEQTTRHPAIPVIPESDDPVRATEDYHLYLYASRFVKNKRILDLHCGPGYGAAFLALNAGDVLAYTDGDPAAESARTTFSEFTRLRFASPSPEDQPPLPADRDVVICFGLLHQLQMEARHRTMQTMKSALTRGGVAIIATPVRSVSSAMNGNGSQLFTPVEFAEFVKEYFRTVLFIGQKAVTVSSIWSLYRWKDDYFRFHTRENLFTLPPEDEQFADPEQLIAICSDETLSRDIIDGSNSFYFDTVQNSRKEERDHKLKALPCELENLRQSLDAATAELAENRISLDGLTEELADACKRSEQISETLADRERTVSALKSDLQNAHASIDTLQQAYDLRTARANALKEEQSSAANRLQEVEQSLDERTQQLQNLAAENMRLRSALSEIEHTVADRTGEIMQLNELHRQDELHLKELQDQMNESAEVHRLRAEELTALRAQVVSLQSLLDERNEHVSSSTEELSAYKEEIRLLHGQIREHEQRAVQVGEEMKRIHHRNEELEQQFQSVDSSSADRESHIRELELCVRELEKTATQRDRLVVEQKNERDELRSRLADIERVLEQKSTEHDAAIKEAEQVRSNEEMNRKALDERNQRVARLEQQTKDQTEFLVNLQRESEENASQARQLKAELEKQIIAFDTYQKSQSDLQQRYTKSQIRVQELQATLALFEQKIERLNAAPGYKFLSSIGFIPKDKI
ncbi:MAG TPA: methyltransferase domain-containing protein [Bacteroidota bacterium]|nr:methyltransferase domain-containing protein [Bacteroidota bacterium]